MFESNGYEIVTIDFRNPELSNHFNILEPIICEYEKYIKYENISKETNDKSLKLQYKNKSIFSYAETNRLITSLSNMIMQDKTQVKDPFWNNSARQLLEGLIGFFLEEYKLGNIKRNQITMTSIRKFQNSSMREDNFSIFKSYIDSKNYGEKSKDSLISIMSASENTYKSITAVFGEKMAIFDDVNIANVTSDTDFSFDMLGRKATALYVIVPDEDKTYYTLITIIVGLLYKELVKLANSQENKKLPIEIDWLLDEFANCPPLSDIESIVSVARSRGMRFHFFIQSFSQLDNVYGKEVAQIILDNCGLVYLKTNTQETAEAISKRLGKKTIESKSLSQSISLFNYNGNKSVSLMARDLLTPDEVKQLHYKAIIFPTVGYPIFRDTVVYDKFKNYIGGFVEREKKMLKNLENTYFVVENIKSNINHKNKVRNNKELEKFLEEQKEFDKQRLTSIELLMKDIFIDSIKDIFYKEENNRPYLSVSLNKKISGLEESRLKGNIKEGMFHIIINNDFENKTIINCYLNNIPNLELEKGNRNNV